MTGRPSAGSTDGIGDIVGVGSTGVVVATGDAERVEVAVAVGLAGGAVGVAVAAAGAVAVAVPGVGVENSGGGSLSTVARMPSGADTPAEPPQAASSRQTGSQTIGSRLLSRRCCRVTLPPRSQEHPHRSKMTPAAGRTLLAARRSDFSICRLNGGRGKRDSGVGEGGKAEPDGQRYRRFNRDSQVVRA